jgi:hypothetical protein
MSAEKQEAGEASITHTTSPSPHKNNIMQRPLKFITARMYHIILTFCFLFLPPLFSFPLNPLLARHLLFHLHLDALYYPRLYPQHKGAAGLRF